MTEDRSPADLFANLHAEWQRSHDPAVLASAIKCGRNALADPTLAPEARVVVSANLCVAFTSQFDLTRARHDIDEAVKHGRDALACSSSTGLGARFSSNLAAALNTRYDLYADPEDLVEAIKLLQDAIEHTPGSDPNRPGRLMNLATALARRFEATKQAEDIDAAITYSKLVVDDTPANDSRLAPRLSSLARMYHWRSIYGSVDQDISEDADRAVHWAQQALAVADPAERSRGRIEELAGATLTHRYEITADRNDIQAAISMLEVACAAPNSAATTLLTRHIQLARALLHRYSQLNDQKDLERAETEVATVIGDTSVTSEMRKTCGELLTYIADQRLQDSSSPESYAAALAARRHAIEASRAVEGQTSAVEP